MPHTRCFLHSQLQQQLSRLAAAAEAYTSNVADRDGFVRQMASKYGLDLAGVGSSVTNSVIDGSADGFASGQLPAAAIEGVLGELRGRMAALQEELRVAKQAHRCARRRVKLLPLLLLQC